MSLRPALLNSKTLSQEDTTKKLLPQFLRFSLGFKIGFTSENQYSLPYEYHKTKNTIDILIDTHKIIGKI